ncbi:MAG TPA: glycosyltransferase [Candidatus Kapabacteria bacterium]|nr:glycosyltransferase [Candidatus Kapabacteria bacterium]
MSKNCVLIKELKAKYGPIMNAVKNTGINIFDFSQTHLIKDYDNIIIFHTKQLPNFETKAKVGWWMNDLAEVGKFDKTIVPFDTIFLCNEEYMEDYKNHFNKNVYYMPQCGMDADNFSGRTINWEVLFIGNSSNKKYHTNRQEILSHIGKKRVLKIINNERHTSDQHYLYSNTKYNLSISMPLQTVTSNRLYNIISSGGFALVSWFPGIDKLFENHKHLVWFNSPEEAISLMEYYDNNIEEYNNIKRNGKELFENKHTASLRLNNMFDILEGKETKFRGWLDYGKK